MEGGGGEKGKKITHTKQISDSITKQASYAVINSMARKPHFRNTETLKGFLLDASYSETKEVAVHVLFSFTPLDGR